MTDFFFTNLETALGVFNSLGGRLELPPRIRGCRFEKEDSYGDIRLHSSLSIYRWV